MNPFQKSNIPLENVLTFTNATLGVVPLEKFYKSRWVACKDALALAITFIADTKQVPTYDAAQVFFMIFSDYTFCLVAMPKRFHKFHPGSASMYDIIDRIITPLQLSGRNFEHNGTKRHKYSNHKKYNNEEERQRDINEAFKLLCQAFTEIVMMDVQTFNEKKHTFCETLLDETVKARKPHKRIKLEL